jgi:hypothetical protein
MIKMNSDGSGKTPLALGMFGNPSTALHNNLRWFIHTYIIPDQYYPDGITRRGEVFALREDFDPDFNNNANTKVQLTDDITLQPLGSTDWVPGDAQISFKARRWSYAGPGATVVEGGIYTASLVFGPDGNIAGLAAQPVAPAVYFPLVEYTPGDPRPALGHYCWDPTGTRVAYAGSGNNDLWVANLLNEHTRIYVGPTYVPQWSPQGDKIAFTIPYSYAGVATIKPDGTGFKMILRNTATWVFARAYWSPNASYIVCTGHQSDLNTDVFRATATGGNLTDLTPTPAPIGELLHPAYGGGWR